MGDVCTEHASFKESLTEIKCALNGPDGDIQRGMVFKVTELVNTVRALSEQIAKHRQQDLAEVKVLRIAVLGDVEAKITGLKGEMKEVKDFIEPQKSARNWVLGGIYRGTMLLGMGVLLYFTFIK